MMFGSQISHEEALKSFKLDQSELLLLKDRQGYVLHREDSGTLYLREDVENLYDTVMKTCSELQRRSSTRRDSTLITSKEAMRRYKLSEVQLLRIFPIGTAPTMYDDAEVQEISEALAALYLSFRPPSYYYTAEGDNANSSGSTQTPHYYRLDSDDSTARDLPYSGDAPYSTQESDVTQP